ncbi:uncharacterized protein LOC128390322 [Panonychus citri]|uniref:uncharacterized protein LOC128390322 n=1 Tax=Panonychus citri TaxID=50023 RepID=UPI002307B738|nr:uncharacterized protein LOC128390322 [Panonychus citri]
MDSSIMKNYRDTFKYSYLGKYFIRPGYETYVWERTDYNYAFEGEKYDKFVTSHYFVSSADAKLFKDFILVRTTTNNYKKVNNDTFKWIETKTKDYYGLEEVESGRDYETELSLRFSDCYQDSTERKTLAIYFTCKDQYNELDCVKYAEKHYNKFLENLKDTLLSQNISPARIANIDLVFEGQNIKALVTFLKIPNIEDSLQKERMKLSQEALSSLDRIPAESAGDCLYKQVEFYYDQEAIVFCYADYTRPSICGRIQSSEKIVKMDAGTICDVYYPVKSYSQFRNEIHLDKMEDYIRRRSLAIYMTDDGFIYYKSTKVVDVTNELDKNKDSFILVATINRKLIDSNVLLAKDVSNLADCYRTCAQDNVTLCETFVYCQYPDKLSCYTSNVIFANLYKRTTEDESCIIYSKNRLLDYIKISSREFKQSSSIAIDAPIGDCASICSSSDECFSFQQCGGSCTLNGYYTDSISQKSGDCDIYIPEVSQQFTSTGRKLVSEVFHTEVNLNLDQCAALCHSWTNTNEPCVSFNYCSQNGEISSCNLSKYSTNDKSANLVDSGVCKNYEYKNPANRGNNYLNDRVSVRGTSGGAAFGIIILFITVGLLLGFIFPMLINGKLKEIVTEKFVSSSSSEREINSFHFSRQRD